MHPELERYRNDERLPLIHFFGTALPFELQAFFLLTFDKINSTTWHWLRFHYSAIPPHPTAIQIADVCSRIEAGAPGLGVLFVDNIVALRDQEKHEPHYEAMLQVLAEMLVIDQIMLMPWPSDAAFRYEPAGRTGKRPEFEVVVADARYLFEVKAPSLLAHKRMRQAREIQLPGRALPREAIETLAKGEPITLPRDNPVKDFLLSAESKFADFEAKDGANILVIVWDDFIYEPITSLINERSGLLTKDSYLKDANGNAVEFLNVDAVVAIRHLSYFYEGLADRPLPDRNGIFDFGGNGALPNVLFPTPWGRKIPEVIASGLRAVDYRHDGLQLFADYRPQELVFWIGDRS